jgi:hypothetical protein
MGRASQARQQNIGVGDTHERGIDDRPAYRSDRERDGAMRVDRTDPARAFDCVSVKPGTARTVKTTAGAVQAGAPFDTKSVAETG